HRLAIRIGCGDLDLRDALAAAIEFLPEAGLQLAQRYVETAAGAELRYRATVVVVHRHLDRAPVARRLILDRDVALVDDDRLARRGAGSDRERGGGDDRQAREARSSAASNHRSMISPWPWREARAVGPRRRGHRADGVAVHLGRGVHRLAHPRLPLHA